MSQEPEAAPGDCSNDPRRRTSKASCSKPLTNADRRERHPYRQDQQNSHEREAKLAGRDDHQHAGAEQRADNRAQGDWTRDLGHDCAPYEIGAGAYFIRGAIAPEIAGPVALGSVVGAVLGARLLVVVTPGKLRLAFVAVLLVLAVWMALAAVGGHRGL